MNIIYKYPLHNTINKIPVGKPLCVAFQKGAPTIWVEHQQDAPDDWPRMEILVYGTGELIPAYSDTTYIGSATSERWVFHVYLRKPEPDK